MNYNKHFRYALLLVTLLFAFNSCSFSSKDQLPALTDDYLVNAIGQETIATASTKVFIKEGFLHASKINSEAEQPSGLPCLFSITRVPSTLITIGNNKTNLSLILVGQSIPKNAAVKAIPIALLTLSADNINLPIIIAVPADPARRQFPAEDFASVEINHPEIIQTIELFFTNQDTLSTASFLWQSEQEAYKLINSVQDKEQNQYN